MFHTYQLIELDNEMKDKRFNPWLALGLEMPGSDPFEGFNTKEVKRAYRSLAKKYHPDKVYSLS